MDAMISHIYHTLLILHIQLVCDIEKKRQPSHSKNVSDHMDVPLIVQDNFIRMHSAFCVHFYVYSIWHQNKGLSKN